MEKTSIHETPIHMASPVSIKEIKQAKQFIDMKMDTIKPMLKAMSKEDKQQAKKYKEQLYWEFLAEVSQTVDNWREVERQQIKMAVQKAVSIAKTYSQSPVHMQHVELKMLRMVILNNPHDEMTSSVVGNLCM